MSSTFLFSSLASSSSGRSSSSTPASALRKMRSPHDLYEVTIMFEEAIK